MSQDLLVKLRGKKKMHRRWKQGQVSWEEYRDSACFCKNEIRKAKEHLEMNFLRDAKTNKKCFYRNVSQKKKVRETLLNEPYKQTDTERQGEC